MGRAVFSQAYATPAVTVRTEPEPTVDFCCERWRDYSHFDPDSEAFFQDAEYEAFVDPDQIARGDAMLTGITARVTVEMSDSNDSSVSDQSSPMAIGSDDPATLIREAFTDRTTVWDDSMQPVVSPTEPEWRPARDTRRLSYTRRPLQVPQIQSSYATRVPREEEIFIPPPIFSDDLITDTVHPSPTIRRFPISNLLNPTETEARSPSPDSPGPSTPPPSQSSFSYRRQEQTIMVSPSPPPSVTPRFYSWQRHAIPAIPTSPTLIHGNRDGPLTNPRARMSFARIDATPTRIQIPNTVM